LAGLFNPGPSPSREALALVNAGDPCQPEDPSEQTGKIGMKGIGDNLETGARSASENGMEAGDAPL